jgi:two-component system, NtrC family, response regulator
MEKLLIVDDDAGIRSQLRWGLTKSYEVLLAEDAGQALGLFRAHQPKVVSLDLGLPPDANGASEGLRLLGDILGQGKGTKVVVVSGSEDRNHALRAIELGAYDFCNKPVDLDELRIILSRAFHLAELEAENLKLKSRRPQDQGLFGIFGQHPQMEGVFSTIRKVSSVDVPVLILGESGTGKEMVARAIHDSSLRKTGAFIPINCGAIPADLLEAELFGHEKGAFTGAHSRVHGKVEYADGGTLFLDEIGEMPPLLQVKLLRFLQEKVIQRVGGRENIHVNARIVAATNANIEAALANGAFREDLYYRISVVSISLPPLRERGDDVLLLANLFLKRYANEFKKRVRCFSTEAVTHLQGYEWPGNVRELENKVKRAVVMCDTPTIEARDLGFKMAAAAEGEELKQEKLLCNVDNLDLKGAKAAVEKALLARAIEQVNGNIMQAAKVLGVSRPTLYDLMKKHGFYVDELTDTRKI